MYVAAWALAAGCSWLDVTKPIDPQDPTAPTGAGSGDDDDLSVDTGTWAWTDSGSTSSWTTTSTTSTPTSTSTSTSTTTTTTTTTSTTTTTTGTDPGPAAVTVYDLQGGLVLQQTEVEVRGVVVTATATYGFYVQDPAGGPSSGIWVYAELGWEGVWPVVPGDELTLVGVYEEFFGLSELNLVDAPAPRVDVTGVGVVVEPAVIGIAEVGEAWEGVLIRVEGLALVEPDAGDNEFVVGDGVSTAVVDDQVHLWSSFGVFPVGATVDAVTGVLNYAGEYVIEPRSDADIESPAATPYTLQLGEVPVGTEVELYGLAVTGLDDDGLFAQAEAGGEHSGVWVYLGAGWEAVWGPVLPGDRVDVAGVANEYYDLTEVDLTTSASPSLVVSGTGPLPVPAVVAVADAGEAWEGVLIEVQDVQVADPNVGFGEWLVTPILGTGQLVVADDLHVWSGAATLAVGDRFDAISGPLTYRFGAFKIEPRADTDVVPR